MHRTLAALLLTLTACSDNLAVDPYDLSEDKPDQAIDAPDQAPDLAPDQPINTPDQDLPPPIPMPNIQLAAGFAHTCAIKGGALYCWGLGSRTADATGAPAIVRGMESDVTAVAAGNFHTCVIKAGALWCWGANDMGQLGIGGDTPATSTPTPVQGMEDVTEISAGTNHTCAIRRGELLCWGSNGQSQLGDPARLSATADRPGLVPGMRGASSVSAGGQHTCALRSEQVWCWGDNLKGQVGEGGVGRPVREPRRIIALEGISSLSAGLAHTCAIQNGMPRCWGNNVNGQLGNNSFADSADPALLDPEIALGVSAISAGHNHTCAIHFDELYCWGSNTKNQTGNGDVQSPTPAVVDGFNDNVTTIATGANHTCAAREGEVWCWGDNSMQQISGSDSPTEPPRRIFLP